MSIVRTTATGLALVASILAFATRADTQEATGKVKAARIFSATTTNSGQPIVLPKGNAEVVVWMYDIPAGSKLPVHKHPSQRYAYVLQGTLQVTDVENSRSWEYKPGDFIVECATAGTTEPTTARNRCGFWSSIRSRRARLIRSCGSEALDRFDRKASADGEPPIAIRRRH